MHSRPPPPTHTEGTAAASDAPAQGDGGDDAPAAGAGDAQKAAQDDEVAEEPAVAKDRKDVALQVNDRVLLFAPVGKAVAAEAVIKVVEEGAALITGKHYKVSCQHPMLWLHNTCRCAQQQAATVYVG